MQENSGLASKNKSPLASLAFIFSPLIILLDVHKLEDEQDKAAPQIHVGHRTFDA
jgi:hypothetical protein